MKPHLNAIKRCQNIKRPTRELVLAIPTELVLIVVLLVQYGADAGYSHQVFAYLESRRQAGASSQQPIHSLFEALMGFEA